MAAQDNLSLDGVMAYLKPSASKWAPLDENAYKTLYGEDMADAEPNGQLSAEEKKWLADSRQDLNEMLSASLQLPNLAFFAGSGTSLGEVGGPSMWDLWCKSMWANPEAREGDADYGKLTDVATSVCTKVRYVERENPNIEHFLSQCDGFLLFSDDDEVSKFVVEVKKTILAACSSFIGAPNSDISAYSGLLQKLARRRVRDPRLKVFTTNYDMCFETAGSELGMMLVDGFSYTRVRRFDGRFFNYDVVRRDNDNHEFVEGVVQLYKLHGSVSWERSENEIYECVSPSAENAALVYPAKGKYQQAFIQPHLELLSRFIEALRTQNNCLLMSGFGFNDDHLSEPIVSAIKSNPSLKLIIADFKVATHIQNAGTNGSSPYWIELADLSASGYDIHFINSSFSDFVKLIPHLRALSPAEQLAKAVKLAGK
ncbi:MAG: SIR2 family protein [Candidatus Thiodiazotropha taylori]|nr:SIR2 family protein [Candidatus Thiodiazotropha taylori]